MSQHQLDIKKGTIFAIFLKLENLFNFAEEAELNAFNSIYREKRDKFSSTLLQKEFERLTIELAWKSAKIEGNTYTLLDTELLIKERITAANRTIDEANMILNHKKALDFILKNPEYYQNLTLFKIEELHHLIVENLDVPFGIRENKVAITGTNYKPLDNKYQITKALEKLITVINSTCFPLAKALIAILLISYIQPFVDGNKRTARLLGDALLLAYDYCPLSYRSVSEVDYRKAMIIFYEQNNAYAFKKLFMEQFENATKEYF